MTPPDYPQQVYRAASKNVLRQGDIALCEHAQLRPRAGERAGPGDADVAGPQIPYLGDAVDYEIELASSHQFAGQKRVVRVWQTPVIVISQNCEIEHADADDSRLIVAPLASRDQWPEGPWKWLRRNQLPGYLYLPTHDANDTSLNLAADIPESAVILANSALVSRALVRARRFVSLSQPMLPLLQEKISRFHTTRGYASDRELESLRGKRVLDVRRTDETVAGPSRLYKLVLAADSGDDQGDDEVTVTVGCRPG
jgi:hypothetical protein